MTNPNPETLRGKYVRFCINDLFLPERASVLDDLHRCDMLRGQVVGISDGGPGGSVFVMIEVPGLRQHCIVPVESVEPAE